MQRIPPLRAYSKLVVRERMALAKQLLQQSSLGPAASCTPTPAPASACGVDKPVASILEKFRLPILGNGLQVRQTASGIMNVNDVSWDGGIQALPHISPSLAVDIAGRRGIPGRV